jgi:hypothetical protein
MKTNDWELVYRDHFLEELALIQTYVSQFSSVRARKLTSGIMTFTTDRILLNPIEGDQLIFLDVYHTSRNK